MRILIVEDELPIAEDIRLLLKQILQHRLTSAHIETTLDNALAYLNEKPIDVLFLDLNLNSRDGFEILKNITSKSFHTIVITANQDRAVEAFEYGVLDFIAKPYNIERLQSALNRLESTCAVNGHALKYLSVKRSYEIQVIPLNEVSYFKSVNIYVELYLKNGKVELYDKSIKRLSPLLPSHYYRIHKSYIINIETIDKIKTLGGGRYRAILKDGTSLPVSRRRIAALKRLLDL